MYGGLRNVHEVAESRVVAKESVAESAPKPVAESIGEIVVVKEFVWLVVSAIAVCRASRTENTKSGQNYPPVHKQDF